MLLINDLRRFTTMQPYPNQPVKTRRPVLIFLKIVGPPLVLYVDPCYGNSHPNIC